MTQLSVNINKIATLRNARGGNNPDVIEAAINCEKFGAQGITVHPRPDERHITRNDVLSLKPILTTEFNIEGYPDARYIDLVCSVHPTQATLVPDSPAQLTSNSGWDCIKNRDFLTPIVEKLQENGIRVSIFVDTNLENIKAAAEIGADRIELYTEPYAAQYIKNRDEAIAPYITASDYAHKLGLGVNAGHDLSLENLAFFSDKMPYLDEVSIGHALICDALYLGLEDTIKRYLNCIHK